MTYKFNATTIDPQPTEGRWLEREQVGRDGNGRVIYAPTRQFEMRFGLLSATGFSALQNYFDGIAATGTVIADLPKYGAPTYVFESYTGCYLDEPGGGPYFSEYGQEIRLLVTNIIT